MTHPGSRCLDRTGLRADPRAKPEALWLGQKQVASYVWGLDAICGRFQWQSTTVWATSPNRGVR